MEQVVSEANCSFGCQFEWLEVSSNVFNISVYTPAFIACLVGYGIYRFVKRNKAKKQLARAQQKVKIMLD